MFQTEGRISLHHDVFLYCEWFLPILLQAFIVKIPATVVVCVATSLVNKDNIMKIIIEATMS